MFFRTCDICEHESRRDDNFVGCPDHLEMVFHARCFQARESLTGFGCPKCEAEEIESED